MVVPWISLRHLVLTYLTNEGVMAPEIQYFRLESYTKECLAVFLITMLN